MELLRTTFDSTESTCRPVSVPRSPITILVDSGLCSLAALLRNAILKNRLRDITDDFVVLVRIGVAERHEVAEPQFRAFERRAVRHLRRHGQQVTGPDRSPEA